MTQALVEQLKSQLSALLTDVAFERNEVTITAAPEHLLSLCQKLRDNTALRFDQLVDLCGVDYLLYGKAEWKTERATENGFSRGVKQEPEQDVTAAMPNRFAVVYHLLSTELNHRLRLRCFVCNEPPQIDSVNDIWNSANWFEREAFDLYGILFNGHPDLRRILTDYGFVGHPFRKDFPLSGHVEMRYDATLGRVIYEPVDITPRVLVPKVIREDSRYLKPIAEEMANG